MTDSHPSRPPSPGRRPPGWSPDGADRSGDLQANTHVFPNGLVLLAEPMDWLESAAFALLVPAGSVHDPDPLGGLANFTCEMALRGAGPLDSREFVETLDNLGADRSETVGKAHALFGAATVADNLLPTMRVFADVVQRPHFPEDELESSRQVMFQELRSVEDEPSQKVMVELRRGHYPKAWGRPSFGTWESVEQITLDDIREQFTKLYRPNGAILGVAGRFDWDELVDQVAAMFGDWKPLDEPPIDPGTRGPRLLHLPADTQQTHIGLAYSSVPYKDEDYFLAWSGLGVLSGGASSRLFTEVRERRGLCYSIYATYHTLLDEGGVFCYAGTSADRAQETLDVAMAEIERLVDGVDRDEIDRLKARIKSALIMQQESSGSRAGSIARDWYHLERIRPLEEIHRVVDELTTEKINAYLAENPPGEFTIVTLGPDELKMPSG